MSSDQGYGSAFGRASWAFARLLMAGRFADHHPIAREHPHGKGLRSRVKRKRKARKARRVYLRFVREAVDMVRTALPSRT